MAYARTPGQRAGDFAAARAAEEQVGEWLGSFKIGHLDSTERLDWWVPGFYLDVKEKRQKLSAKWPLPPGCENADAFVIDELSVRKALAHYPHAYFMMHDVPLERWFLARIDEVVCADRTRLNRVGPTGHPKGKWILDLSQFKRIYEPDTQLMAEILNDQVTTPWKGSACLVPAVEL